MKKYSIVSLILVLILSFSLIGCYDGSVECPESPVSPESPDSPESLESSTYQDEPI